MKKLIGFLAGLIIIVLMCGAMFLAGAIFDTGEKTTIEPYFFQKNNIPAYRPGVPATPADLGENSPAENKMLNMLITKYVTEYLYITPNLTETQQRIEGKTSLRIMSTMDVFNTWVNKIAPEIRDMADDGVLRIVNVNNIVKDKDYWIVEYELNTWYKPNDMSETPTKTQGIIYMTFRYEVGLRQNMGTENVTDYLEQGNDPAAAFKFLVTNMVLQ